MLCASHCARLAAVAQIRFRNLKTFLARHTAVGLPGEIQRAEGADGSNNSRGSQSSGDGDTSSFQFR